MMGIDDIVASFGISVGAGYVPSIIAKIKGDKTLEDRMDACFHKALDKWEISAETRNLMYHDRLNHMGDLETFLTDKKQGIHPKTKELLRLWICEMQNDEVCSNFIILHKQDVTDCKLDTIHATLKDELCAKIDEVIENQQEMKNDLGKILKHIQGLSASDEKALAANIMSLLNGVVATLIEELKMDSAIKIINEIETQFARIIEEDNVLKSEMFFQKGQSLLIRNIKDAIPLLQKAYHMQPTIQKYIMWEVRRLIGVKEYDMAANLAEKLTLDKSWSYLVIIVQSDDVQTAYQNVPDEYRNLFEFRQRVFEALLTKKDCNAMFLFNECEITLPQSLIFKNIDEWLYILSYYRMRLGDFMILSFDAPQVNSIEIPRQVINIFEDKLYKTEVRDCYPIIRCLYCYWNYISTRNGEWINEFQKVDRKYFNNQKFVFSLMETSMLILEGRHEEAFAVVVSIGDQMNSTLLRFVIMMSIQTQNILHLRWILEQVNIVNMKIANEEAVLIAHSINGTRAMETFSALTEVNFEDSIDKKILLQLCNYYAKKKIETSSFKDNIETLNDEMKAYAAMLLATEGDTQLAFEMLRPIVDDDVRDVKQRIFLNVLSMMQEKTPDLYKILVNNRNAGNECDDQLLRTEYQLDSIVADYGNALGAINELYIRHPDDDLTFVNYLYTLSHIHSEELQQYKEKALNIQYSQPQNAIIAYRAFAENGYIDTAAELLYRNAKIFEDYGIRTFYHNETLNGLIARFAHKEYEVAEEGNFVLCDIDGKRLFYKATANETNIGKAMLAAKKDDEIEVEIGLKLTKLTVIGVFNKYYKLASDIMREAQDGSNPSLIPFQIDMEHPIESLKTIIKKLSHSEDSPEERRKKAYEQYEQGELALMQLVDNDNLLSGYYKLLFTPFKIHVSNSTLELLRLQQVNIEGAVFILDMPTAITFAEFTAKTDIEINGPMTVTTVLHDYIRTAHKSAIRLTDGDLYEAMRSGYLSQYSQYVDIDAMEHISKLLAWVDSHCLDVVADKALALMVNKERTPLKNQLFSSLSMLMQPDHFFVTDDVKIMSMLPSSQIISTETYVKLFNDQVTTEAYSEFLFNCNFFGVDLSEDFIVDEYRKMKTHGNNKIVAIMQNLQENPCLFTKAISAGIKLASSELDTRTLKVSLTNMYAMAFKAYNHQILDNALRIAKESMNIPLFPFQFVRECILDAEYIIKGGVK